MQILALETSGKYGSAAVIDEAGRTAYAVSGGEMNHLTEIVALIESAMNEFETDKSAITHVAASVGPGSFTGIRIGVSLARALGQMLELPCLAVSSLEGLSVLAADSDEYMRLAASKAPVNICTIINARRHQTYGAVRCNGQAVLPERQYMIEEILELLGGLNGPILFTGDGIDAYGDFIERNMEGLMCRGRRKSADFAFAAPSFRYQRADAVARLAVSLAESGETLVYDKLLPEYMRKSEAEMKLEEGHVFYKRSH